MSSTRRFTQLDVFSDRALLGNALAVVHGADGLSDARMAAFARWTNLSETSFLFAPTEPLADYRVRIFTPRHELPFAGHPTLGSCQAWLDAGGVPRDAGVVVQQCGVGLVRVRRERERLAFAAPPLRRSGPLDTATLAQIVAALGIEAADVLSHQWVDNGPHWCAVMLRSAAQVLALVPDMRVVGDLNLGVVGAHAADSQVQFEVRAFIPSDAIDEDPVTGSLHAGLAQWLIGAGLAPSCYVAAQGAVLGRAGRVFVEHDGVDVWIGGHVSGCIEGAVRL